MIIDETWRAIGCEPQTLLCEMCLHNRVETRLDRSLTFRDLTVCPFNYGWLRPDAEPSDIVPFFDPYIARWLAKCIGPQRRRGRDRLELLKQGRNFDVALRLLTVGRNSGVATMDRQMFDQGVAAGEWEVVERDKDGQPISWRRTDRYAAELARKRASRYSEREH